VPKLQAAGWEDEPHRLNEQVTFTDGRIVVAGRRSRRRPGKRADYILRYRPDLAIAVVEAKPDYATPGDGLQQAKDYAEVLGLKFATYQAIARDEHRPGLYREYAADFFDLIIVDECHRGSACDDSNWREILEYFEPAYQLGMTATPRRQDNADTYNYFGDPIYTYSLRQGIDDGFLAPYRVHRIVTTWDPAGWRPSQGEPFELMTYKSNSTLGAYLTLPRLVRKTACTSQMWGLVYRKPCRSWWPFVLPSLVS
jgi:type I site-specific restriction endonuclease